MKNARWVSLRVTLLITVFTFGRTFSTGSELISLQRQEIPGSFSRCRRKQIHQAQMVSSAGEDSESSRDLTAPNPAILPDKRGGYISKHLPTVLFVLLVTHKCATDVLSRYTRMSDGVAISATTISAVSELVKIPILTVAIGIFAGVGRIGPIVKEAVTDKPFVLALPSLAWAIQNVLYFQALSHLSPASYQILSQTKMIFTALFMYTLLDKRLNPRQIMAIVLIIASSVATQISEVSRNSIIGGGNALYGALFTVLGALLSALPNVYYEKILKTKGQNLWAKNIQVTFWINFWLLCAAVRAGEPLTLGGLSTAVWAVAGLQGLKCVLIPATLKYTDNIVYSYAKPASIILTAVCTTVASRILPTAPFLIGMGFMLASIWLYTS